MIQQSTAIVHVKVTGSSAGSAGKDIYTYYQLQVIENPEIGVRSNPTQTLTVAVPGGRREGSGRWWPALRCSRPVRNT